MLCTKVVIDHPDWILNLPFNVFGSHTNVSEALDIFTKHNIWIIKEEAITSHSNQPYYQRVTKREKATHSKLLDVLRSPLKVHIDQFQIITVLIAAIWIAFLLMFNMYPGHRISYDKWIEKIKKHMNIGELTTNEKKKSYVDTVPSL